MFNEQKALLKVNNRYKIKNSKKKYKIKKTLRIINDLNPQKYSYKKCILITTTLIIFLFLFIFIIFKKFKTHKNVYTVQNEKNIINKTNQIPIASSINNNYVYPIIVAMTSILYNSSPTSFFTFYLLLAPDVQEENLKKISGLKDKYSNCKFVFIHVENKFTRFFTGYYKSPTIYYRLELSNLITDVNKIIYLDVDTITHKDLTQFYNLDMGKYYYLGFPGHDLVNFEINGTRNFINSGCMLVNLEKLRECNAPKLFFDFYEKFGTKKYDEYVINSVFYNKISFLPLIYGIPDFGFTNPSTSTPEVFLKKFKNYINYTVEDMEYASKNRVITHGCYEIVKWWEKKYDNLTSIGKQWLFYASKSNVFDEICQKYKQFEQQCQQLKNENKTLLIESSNIIANN